MAVENWIDEIVKAAGEVANSRGGFVRSYRVFEREEFPEAMTEFPCAITYPTAVYCSYSDAGPGVDVWHGVTELHTHGNAAKSNLPDVMRYFARIKNAFALHRKLGGKVDHFVIRNEVISIEGPLVYRYGGDGEEHHGLRVQWEVKEIVDVTTGV